MTTYFDRKTGLTCLRHIDPDCTFLFTVDLTIFSKSFSIFIHSTTTHTTITTNPSPIQYGHFMTFLTYLQRLQMISRSRDVFHTHHSCPFMFLEVICKVFIPGGSSLCFRSWVNSSQPMKLFSGLHAAFILINVP